MGSLTTMMVVQLPLLFCIVQAFPRYDDPAAYRGDNDDAYEETSRSHNHPHPPPITFPAAIVMAMMIFTKKLPILITILTLLPLLFLLHFVVIIISSTASCCRVQITGSFLAPGTQLVALEKPIIGLRHQSSTYLPQ